MTGCHSDAVKVVLSPSTSTEMIGDELTRFPATIALQGRLLACSARSCFPLALSTLWNATNCYKIITLLGAQALLRWVVG